MQRSNRLAASNQRSARNIRLKAKRRTLTAVYKMEHVKSFGLNAIANLTGATIAEQRWAVELKPRDEKLGEAEATDRVAQAPLRAHLIWRGRDDERSIPGSIAAPGNLPAAHFQFAPHRSSPRIAADPYGYRPVATSRLRLTSARDWLNKQRKNSHFTLAQALSIFW
jgi:hypothetical protein